MKQFKLTDVEGKEFILEVPEMGECHVKLPPVEPPKPTEPEIKVGMWVVTAMSTGDEVHYVSRIDSYNRLQYDEWNNKGHFHSGWEKYVRPATPAEIEAHLKKVCEKYVGKKVKCLQG